MRNLFSPVPRNSPTAVTGTICLLIFALAGRLFAGELAPPVFDPAKGIISNAEVAVSLPDGKILACRNAYPRPDHLPFVRLNTDGSTDATFSVGDLGITYVNAILPLANGQILLEASLAGESSDVQLIRLNADGSLDTILGNDSYFFDTAHVLPDGKILLLAWTEDGSPRLARLNTDGSPDGTFNSAAPGDYGFQVEADGDILLGSGGDADDDNENAAALTRLGPDGALKEMITLPNFPAGYASAILSLADGKIAVALSYSDDDDNEFARVFRLNADGTVDTAFDSGVVFDGSVTKLVAGNGGSLLVQGWFGTADAVSHSGLARLDAGGTLDAGYDPAGVDGRSLLDKIFTASGELDALAYTWTVNDDGSVDTSYALDHFDVAGQLAGTVPLDSNGQSFSLVARADGTGAYVIAAPGSDFITLQPGDATVIHPPAAGGNIISARRTAVTISAVRSKVYSGSKEPGKFILRRGGADLSKPLRIVYRVQGSAVAGRDYRSVRRVRIIPAGQRVARISIRPVGHHFNKPEGGHAHVTIRLLPRADYRLGTKHAAKVRLIDRAALSTPQG